MAKTNNHLNQKNVADLPFEGLLLECSEDRYKIPYAALRWAKEIKQKENLPDPVQFLVPRAVREILGGKVTLKDIEKLPMLAKVAPAPAPAPAAPTITLNPEPEPELASSSKKEDKKDDKEEDKEDEE